MSKNESLLETQEGLAEKQNANVIDKKQIQDAPGEQIQVARVRVIQNNDGTLVNHLLSIDSTIAHQAQILTSRLSEVEKEKQELEENCQDLLGERKIQFISERKAQQKGAKIVSQKWKQISRKYRAMIGTQQYLQRIEQQNKIQQNELNRLSIELAKLRYVRGLYLLYKGIKDRRRRDIEKSKENLNPAIHFFNSAQTHVNCARIYMILASFYCDTTIASKDLMEVADCFYKSKKPFEKQFAYDIYQHIMNRPSARNMRTKTRAIKLRIQLIMMNGTPGILSMDNLRDIIITNHKKVKNYLERINTQLPKQITIWKEEFFSRDNIKLLESGAAKAKKFCIKPLESFEINPPELDSPPPTEDLIGSKNHELENAIQAMKKKHIIIQKLIRGQEEKTFAGHKLESIIILQKLVRGYPVKSKYDLVRQSTTTIQRLMRGHQARARAVNQLESIITIQKLARGRAAKINYNLMRQARIIKTIPIFHDFIQKFHLQPHSWGYFEGIKDAHRALGDQAQTTWLTHTDQGVLKGGSPFISYLYTCMKTFHKPENNEKNQSTLEISKMHEMLEFVLSILNSFDNQASSALLEESSHFPSPFYMIVVLFGVIAMQVKLDNNLKHQLIDAITKLHKSFGDQHKTLWLNKLKSVPLEMPGIPPSLFWVLLRGLFAAPKSKEILRLISLVHQSCIDETPSMWIQDKHSGQLPLNFLTFAFRRNPKSEEMLDLIQIVHERLDRSALNAWITKIDMCSESGQTSFEDLLIAFNRNPTSIKLINLVHRVQSCLNKRANEFWLKKIVTRPENGETPFEWLLFVMRKRPSIIQLWHLIETVHEGLGENKNTVWLKKVQNKEQTANYFRDLILAFFMLLKENETPPLSQSVLQFFWQSSFIRKVHESLGDKAIPTWLMKSNIQHMKNYSLFQALLILMRKFSYNVYLPELIETIYNDLSLMEQKFIWHNKSVFSHSLFQSLVITYEKTKYHILLKMIKAVHQISNDHTIWIKRIGNMNEGYTAFSFLVDSLKSAHNMPYTLELIESIHNNFDDSAIMLWTMDAPHDSEARNMFQYLLMTMNKLFHDRVQRILFLEKYAGLEKLCEFVKTIHHSVRPASRLWGRNLNATTTMITSYSYLLWFFAQKENTEEQSLHRNLGFLVSVSQDLNPSRRHWVSLPQNKMKPICLFLSSIITKFELNAYSFSLYKPLLRMIGKTNVKTQPDELSALKQNIEKLKKTHKILSNAKSNFYLLLCINHTMEQKIGQTLPCDLLRKISFFAAYESHPIIKYADKRRFFDNMNHRFFTLLDKRADPSKKQNEGSQNDQKTHSPSLT